MNGDYDPTEEEEEEELWIDTSTVNGYVVRANPRNGFVSSGDSVSLCRFKPRQQLVFWRVGVALVAVQGKPLVFSLCCPFFQCDNIPPSTKVALQRKTQKLSSTILSYSMTSWPPEFEIIVCVDLRNLAATPHTEPGRQKSIEEMPEGECSPQNMSTKGALVLGC